MAERIITVFHLSLSIFSFNWIRTMQLSLSHTQKNTLWNCIDSAHITISDAIVKLFYGKLLSSKSRKFETIIAENHTQNRPPYKMIAKLLKCRQKNHAQFIRIMKILIWWVTGTYCENVLQPRIFCSAIRIKSKTENPADLRNYYVCLHCMAFMETSRIAK